MRITDVPILDPRLIMAGRVTNDQLVAFWADHTPAHAPAPLTCPGCGYVYTRSAPLCPTATLIKKLMSRRRHEIGNTTLLNALTYNQFRDLVDPHIHKLSTFQAAPLDLSSPAPTTAPVDDLFDTHPYQRRGGAR